jgi:hypothetical protein
MKKEKRKRKKKKKKKKKKKTLHLPPSLPTLSFLSFTNDYDIRHPANNKSDKFEVSADILRKRDDHCGSQKSDLSVAPLCKPDTPTVRVACQLFLSGTFSPDFHPVRRSLFCSLFVDPLLKTGTVGC